MIIRGGENSTQRRSRTSSTLTVRCSRRPSSGRR
jgi:hypothetical protein